MSDSAPALTEISSALALRLRDIARMLDRLDRLESGSGDWLAGQENGALEEAASEMTLRALRAASDPVNFGILRFLAARASAPIGELEQACGLGRLALNERLNDLVQVGLAGRNIDTNHVQGTPAGVALVELIEQVAQAAAARLEQMLRPATG